MSSCSELVDGVLKPWMNINCASLKINSVPVVPGGGSSAKITQYGIATEPAGVGNTIRLFVLPPIASAPNTGQISFIGSDFTPSETAYYRITVDFTYSAAVGSPGDLVQFVFGVNIDGVAPTLNYSSFVVNNVFDSFAGGFSSRASFNLMSKMTQGANSYFTIKNNYVEVITISGGSLGFEYLGPAP